jgi:hypothetical protein
MLKLMESRYFTVCELAEKSGLPESTVRFYLKNVLAEFLVNRFPDLKTRKGKTSLYPALVLDRLRFIRMAKTELEMVSENQRTPTMHEIRNWMNTLTDGQISSVLDGTDTLEFGVARVKDGNRYIERIKPADKPCPEIPEDAGAPMHVIKVTKGVEIRHIAPLSQRQKQLLAPITKLMELVFREG